MRFSAFAVATLISTIALQPALAETAAAPAPAPAPAAAPAATPAPAAPAETAAATPATPDLGVLKPKNPLNMNPPANKDGLVIGQKADVTRIASLRNIMKKDATAIYTGNENGLESYYLINGSQGQIVYITPDSQGIIIGMMFGADGLPTTFLQLDRLNRSGFDITPYMDEEPALPSTTPADTSQSPETLAKQQAYLKLTGQITGSPPPPQAPAKAVSPGEQLLDELNNASWFSFGNPTAPAVTAFVDHRCGDCHQFFKQMMPLAQQNKIYLRLVPTVLVPSDAKRKQEAINLLSSDNPASVWTDLIMKETPIPAPAAANSRAAEAIDKNIELFKRWSLPGTPYVVYRGKDNGVKVMLDKPKDLNAFLTDLGVTP